MIRRRQLGTQCEVNSAAGDVSGRPLVVGQPKVTFRSVETCVLYSAAHRQVEFVRPPICLSRLDGGVSPECSARWGETAPLTSLKDDSRSSGKNAPELPCSHRFAYPGPGCSLRKVSPKHRIAIESTWPSARQPGVRALFFGVVLDDRKIRPRTVCCARCSAPLPSRLGRVPLKRPFFFRVPRPASAGQRGSQGILVLVAFDLLPGRRERCQREGVRIKGVKVAV